MNNNGTNTEYISDDLNPDLIFNMTDRTLLIKIIKGEIDPVELAKKQMEGRGFDLNNEWIGFKKAEEYYKNVK